MDSSQLSSEQVYKEFPQLCLWLLISVRPNRLIFNICSPNAHNNEIFTPSLKKQENNGRGDYRNPGNGCITLKFRGYLKCTQCWIHFHSLSPHDHRGFRLQYNNDGEILNLLFLRGMQSNLSLITTYLICSSFMTMKDLLHSSARKAQKRVYYNYVPKKNVFLFLLLFFLFCKSNCK